MPMAEASPPSDPEVQPPETAFGSAGRVEALPVEDAAEAKSRLRRLAPPLLVVILAALGLGVLIGILLNDGDSEDIAAEGDRPGSTGTHPGQKYPFTADAPDGFKLVTAAPGGWRQTWGDDSAGNDSPFTVISDGTRRVTLVATGFEGMQGRLEQAFVGYSPGNEELTINGHSALYGPPLAEPGIAPVPARLIVEMGDDMAIGLSGAGITRDELVTLAGHATPAADNVGAPVVDGLPAPWKVLGSVDADVLGAIDGQFQAGTNYGPGPSSGLALGWTHESGRLSVVTLRGEAADLDAFGESVPLRDGMVALPHPVTVDGRPGVVLEIVGSRETETDSPRWYRASLLTDDVSGALVVVSVSMPDQSVVAEADLIAVAESVREADQKAWDETASRLKVEAAGGPGLHPDPGRIEIGRGVAGDLEWLLQTSDDPQAIAEAGSVDVCLKLSDYTRSCAFPSTLSTLSDDLMAGNGLPDNGGQINWEESIGISTYFATRGQVAKDFQPFIITAMSVPKGADMNGFSLRATTEGKSVSSNVLPVPGTSSFVAVSFVGDVDTAICTTDPAPPPGLFKPVRLEVFGRQGEVLTCLGI